MLAANAEPADPRALFRVERSFTLPTTGATYAACDVVDLGALGADWRSIQQPVRRGYLVPLTRAAHDLAWPGSLWSTPLTPLRLEFIADPEEGEPNGQD
jgi:hypothetical protein